MAVVPSSHFTCQYTSGTTRKEQNVAEAACARTMTKNKMVRPWLHAFILACKRVTDMKWDREPLQTDSSQCRQQAQSQQGNVYSLLAVTERR